jgi:hypothetical protein
VRFYRVSESQSVADRKKSANGLDSPMNRQKQGADW